jgi:hypothetical protein
VRREEHFCGGAPGVTKHAQEVPLGISALVAATGVVLLGPETEWHVAVGATLAGGLNLV